MSTGNSNTAGAVASVNGNEVDLSPATENTALPDASGTEWIVVKFDRFVDYNYKQELMQQHLEVHEHLGDYSYLCKYIPDDLRPIANMAPVSHVALYPDSAVPQAGITHDAAPGPVPPGSESTFASSAKIPLVIELQPNPAQSAAQVLEQIQRLYGAENLDSEVSGSTIRVNLDPTHISDVAKIDSVRTIANILERVPFTVHQRSVMNFTTTTASNTWKGNGEIVHIADTGFDLGKTDDVPAAFTGRVLAAATAVGVPSAADSEGHGTHVAGSVLGNLSRSLTTGTPPTPVAADMSNIEGTAPGSKLVSIAIFGARSWPSTRSFLTQQVPNCGKPVIVNNSWGNSYCEENADDVITKWSQNPYTPGTGKIVDDVMYKDPQVCLVFAAGNDGTKKDSAGRQQQIGDYASAKNCITVGASLSDRPIDDDSKYTAPPGGKIHNTHEMAYFSSIGPTSFGCMKPDVVAPGSVILSARSRSIAADELQECLKEYGTPSNSDLLFMSGTSMSTPAVTGCVAVLRGAFRSQYPGVTPTGALLKALIVHGAVDGAGTKFKYYSQTQEQYANRQRNDLKEYTMTPAPNPFQGYGLVNINNSLVPITGAINGQRGFVDSSLATGVHTVHTMTIPNSANRVTVTLAYTDPAGEALQNQIALSVKLSNNFVLNPLPPTDPMGRTITWKPSNVAKIVHAHPIAGAANIILNIQTMEPSARFAVVWTVT